MKIRWKLLVLLLIMTLLPLLLSGIYSYLSVRQLGDHLASQTRERLTTSAEKQLQALVDEYARTQREVVDQIQTALTIQAREIERRLGHDPAVTDRIYLSAEYDAGREVPGLTASSMHFKKADDGSLSPLAVTYLEQVFFIVQGVEPVAVANDMARLATMPEVYFAVHELLPDLTYWQYTALESGFHSSYPGHGGYPEDYDPRRREWYTAARDSGEIVWLRPLTEVSTRTVQLAVSMPVYRPDGSFAGVTAIDVPLDGLLGRLPAHAEWGGDVWSALVLDRVSDGEGKLRILADRSYEDRNQDWRHHPEQRYLESSDTAKLEQLRKDALSGNSGILRMEWEGQDALWAYGAGAPNRAFAVVIVPYATIVGPAEDAERYVIDRTKKDMKAGGIIVAVMLVFAALVALERSRKLSRPIRDVAAAAHELMGGNYRARVDIRTGDEIQELAEVVNQVGPALEEHQRMQRSLELTMGIQQHLLPGKTPALEGFDISARCVYSEETGGDYYDFVPLIKLGEGKLGIALGDVCGHGLPAAMLMASARGVLRSQIDAFPEDLNRVFAALNRHFINDAPMDRFMTLFFAVLDGPSRSMVWTSGGQGPILWLHGKTGEVENLEVTGAGIGIMEDATYEHSGPIKLEPGDVIVAATDGILETTGGPDGEEFGEENLKKLMGEIKGGSADEIRDAIISTVATYRGDAPQEDDVTMIVIKAV